ncbi:clathrin interactor 1 isoform X2 [Nematostella vectensis]|uniref:clathrin interactor 1 isoform X2 n=1 Tax=Nematostella vectensis TaxID=45351 RepID=UPI0020778C30|nr:clathrin interactor 1 isoform X2 [Nematostella vectensis]
MWKIREISDKVTNVVMNYSEVEAKVREATNDDTWGPHGSLMQEIAKYTFTYEHFPEVMSMLWKRMLQEPKKYWRRIYKSLLLLGYLLKNGSDRVVTNARDHIYDMRQLENFHHTDENGKDQGINVRHKVKELIELVQDDDRIRSERKRAKKNRDKYTGVSSENYRDSHYSDRYDSAPSGQDQFDEFNSKTTKKSKYREWRERAGSFGHDYKDSESEAEEASEEKDKEAESEDGLDSTNKKGLFKSTPTRTLDLGAAAHYRGVATETPATVNGTSSATSIAPTSGATTESSDLVDLLFGGSSSNTAAKAAAPANQADDPFADFQSASPVKSEGFADFTQATAASTSEDFGDFADFKSSSATQSNNISDDSFFAGMNSASHLSQTGTNASLITSNEPLASMMTAAPTNLMGSGMTMPTSSIQQPAAGLGIGMQPMAGMGMSSMSSPMVAMPTSSAGMGMSTGVMGASSVGMMPQGGMMSAPGMQPQLGMPVQSGMMQPNMPNYQLAQQHKVTTPNNMKQRNDIVSSKSTTWSNSPVNINLDDLVPTLNREKPQQPSMNQLQSQQPGSIMMASPYNNQHQMPAYGLVPGMQQMNIQPNMGQMNMQPNMGQMNMQPNMGQMNMQPNIGQMNMQPNMGQMNFLGRPLMGSSMGVSGGVMAQQPMGASQGFGSNSYTSYKGVS